MRVQMVGCSYHHARIELRERLAFNPQQTAEALNRLREQFPQTEAVLLSTCNRMEIYTAVEDAGRGPSHEDVARFVADFHCLPLDDVFDDLFERSGEDAVRHLFTVAASLDSMVLGEPQILSQVKQAYALAEERSSTGPLTHGIFQAALRVARRVATETSLHQRRVSIPSVAIGDFASQIFEKFEDKQVLVIGAGEMGEETLRYLAEKGANAITVVNRTFAHAAYLAARWKGRAERFEQLPKLLTEADLVISTTGAKKPIVTLETYRQIEPGRYQRPLFVLDLAVPRDFEPSIGDRLGVYLYSLDDLERACQSNRHQRDKELPAAMHIVEQETTRFMQDLQHRSTAPIIKRLKQGWHEPKEDELRRLFNKLPALEPNARDEIRQSFDRLINKLLHPPLESLRNETGQGATHGLVDALKRLFRLED